MDVDVVQANKLRPQEGRCSSPYITEQALPVSYAPLSAHVGTFASVVAATATHQTRACPIRKPSRLTQTHACSCRCSCAAPQHSTGSGKSFTIAALAVALAGWADGGGGCVHTVLVVNDRLQLDKQLGACVEAFWRGERAGRGPALWAAVAGAVPGWRGWRHAAVQVAHLHAHSTGRGGDCWPSCSGGS